MKKSDYVEKIESSFSDRSKFEIINEDPTSKRLKSFQSYLNRLHKRGVLSDELFKRIRPQNAKPARAHGLPKTHKAYDNLPPFRPIIDTTGTTHYATGKYLCELLGPLGNNTYSLKDSFDAAERLRNLSPINI